MTTVLLAFIVFLAYLAAIFSLFGVPTSLSDTYYLLDRKMKDTGCLFTLLMFVMAFLIIMPLFDITPEEYKALAFFIVLGIAFVGAAPLFDKKDPTTPDVEPLVHYISAALSAVCGMGWVFIVNPELFYVPIIVSTLIIIASILTKSVVKGLLFWAEMIVFFSVYGVIILKLILQE